MIDRRVEYPCKVGKVGYLGEQEIFLSWVGVEDWTVAPENLEEDI